MNASIARAPARSRSRGTSAFGGNRRGYGYAFVAPVGLFLCLVIVLPLAHAFVTPPGETPERWILFLHGILGSGANWRTFAKNLVAEKPGWGAVLVDLRLHGESREGFPPPHTLGAAAADVIALEKGIPGPIGAIVAHSFGGKVALEHARQTNGAVPDDAKQPWSTRV